MSEENVLTPSKSGFIDAAMLSIKNELAAVTKKADNPFFKSKYADLNTHLKAVEPLAQKNGCLLTQETVADARIGKNIQRTTITHVESGQSKESFVYLPEIAHLQKLGSAITYARRYTLSALLSMQAEDDDAESTIVRKKTKKVANNGDF